MTRPTGLTLVPLDIPVDFGMLWESEDTKRAVRCRLGLDVRGTLYLIYTDPHDYRPRVSTTDPKWSPNCGLRYITWAR